MSSPRTSVRAVVNRPTSSGLVLLNDGHNADIHIVVTAKDRRYLTHGSCRQGNCLLKNAPTSSTLANAVQPWDPWNRGIAP